jgi:cobalt-precorrin-5B (C1)-methyltransferase
MAKIKEKLRIGFSTGTAATAAARAALRHLLTGEAPQYVAVRLPIGIFLPVLISENRLTEDGASASVIKDGGDDPDVTHKAEIQASVRCLFAGPASNPPETAAGSAALTHGASAAAITRHEHLPPLSRGEDERSPAGGFLANSLRPGICMVAGEGIGIATKPGLPIGIGEPAVNPVPRMMLTENLTEEISHRGWNESLSGCFSKPYTALVKPHVFFPWNHPKGWLNRIRLEVTIRAPRGLELARHTLNPRLGIVGGISILGTTGLVKPFSHEAYKETIQAELSVAAATGCRSIVLSTGGKSERFARQVLKDWPEEAFVQIADFFAFALDEARQTGFEKVVLSVFFGKAVKMAQGHRYTHAHHVPLDLGPVAEQARKAGYPPGFCRDLAGANTAREVLDLLLANRAEDLIRTVAQDVLKQASRLVRDSLEMRLLLFGYDGSLLLDLEGP